MKIDAALSQSPDDTGFTIKVADWLSAIAQGLINASIELNIPGQLDEEAKARLEKYLQQFGILLAAAVQIDRKADQMAVNHVGGMPASRVIRAGIIAMAERLYDLVPSQPAS